MTDEMGGKLSEGSGHWSQQFAGLGMGAVPPELQEWNDSTQEERFAMERPVVAFDIDSTVSESQWRLPLINNWDADEIAIEDRLGRGSREDGMYLHSFVGAVRETRWDLFYSLAPFDQPYEIAQQLVGSFREVFDIIYVTGRPEKWRADTWAWIQEHDMAPLGRGADRPDAGLVESRDWLLMRPDGWFAPAAEVKMTLLSRYGIVPMLVLDDDITVVQALNLEGIAATVCAWHGGEIRGSTRG